MKKSFSLLTLALAALPAAAALPEDTVVTVTRPDSVILLQSDSTVHLSIYGREDDDTYRFDYDKKFSPEGRVVTHQKTSGLDFTLPFLRPEGQRGKSYFSMGGVGFGFVNALGAPDPMNVNMAASYEVFADLLTYGRYVGPHADLSIGFGINWRNYRMNGRTRFVMNGGCIGLSPYPDGADIENMEGAALFALCREFGADCCQIRAISNAVGEERGGWRVKEAVTALHETLDKII